MAQAVTWFSGFETGGQGDLASFGAGASIDATTFRTGAYALKCAATQCNLKTAMSATTWILRFALYYPSTPGADTTIMLENGNGTTRLQAQVTTGDRIKLLDAGVLLGL